MKNLEREHPKYIIWIHIAKALETPNDHYGFCFAEVSVKNLTELCESGTFADLVSDELEKQTEAKSGSRIPNILQKRR